MRQNNSVNILFAGRLEQTKLPKEFKLVCVTDFMNVVRIFTWIAEQARLNIEFDFWGGIEQWSRDIGYQPLNNPPELIKDNKETYPDISKADVILSIYDGMVSIYTKLGWKYRMKLWFVSYLTRPILFLLGSTIALVFSAISMSIKESALYGGLSSISVYNAALLFGLLWVLVLMYIIISIYKADIKCSKLTNDFIHLLMMELTSDIQEPQKQIE